MNMIYDRLSQVSFLTRSYANKFLFIAFLGIHIPLIGLICFIIAAPHNISALSIFIITLILTLAATGITLYVLRALLEPLTRSKNAMEAYVKSKELPELPKTYKDEAGALMCNVQETITKLDTLLEEKKDLISILSHDLRTPLGSIKLLSSGLKNKNISADEIQTISTQITSSVNDQLALLHDILEGLKHDEFAWLNLATKKTHSKEVLLPALRDVEPVAASKNVELTLADTFNDYLQVDQRIFPQVVKNLMNNAIKFSQPGSKIDVNISRQKNVVHILVKDQGIGFDPEDAEHLFEKFTSKRKMGTNNEPTTGLGLYLSRKIVEAHGGTLTAHSDGANHGSSFIISLPGGIHQ